jgi:hypothetical protein
MSESINPLLPQLKKGEKLVTTTQIAKTSKSPQYLAIGNGVATQNFPADVVVDALELFGALTKEQQGIVLFLKDRMVMERMAAYQSNQTMTNPNAVTLRRSDFEEEDQRIRDLLRAHQNRKTLIEKNIIREIGKKGELMLNPFMFIPPNDFDSVRAIWDEHDPANKTGK